MLMQLVRKVFFFFIRSIDNENERGYEARRAFGWQCCSDSESSRHLSISLTYDISITLQLAYTAAKVKVHLSFN